MSAGDPLLDRAAIEDAFRRLGERLARRGVVADLYVFGGAAMALAYDARRLTRDIDAAFQPHGVVLDEARAVAGGDGRAARHRLVADATVGVIANPMSGRDIRRLVASASVFPNAEKRHWWSG